MDRGCLRPPRPRFRLTILVTILGLALTALLPVVRSAPGLSRTPRRGLAPVLLAYVPADPSDPDFDPADPSTIPPDRQEEGPCDFEELTEETSSVEWMTDRPSRARESDRARAVEAWWSTDTRMASPAVRPGLRNTLIAGSTRSGLSVRLCRLLF